MKIELICKNCNELFITEFKHRDKKFCNQTCYLEYGRKNKTLGKPKDNTIRETRNCVECGKEFVAKIKQEKKLCSQECRLKWGHKDENKKIRLEKTKEAIQKKYGVDSLFKTKEFQKKVKEIIFEKYGVYNTSKIPSIIEKQKQTVKEKHLAQLLPRIKENDLVLLDDYTTNKGKIYNFQCTKCDFIFTSTLLGCGKIPTCSKCYPINKNSSLEIEIKEFLNSKNIKHIDNEKTTLKGKEIDVLVPDFNLGIEVDGIYFHSEKVGNKGKDYHLNKSKLANDVNVKLIHIFEDELLHKKDIVFSRISNLLNLNEKIYARKCTIKEVTKKVSQDFLNKNHIQGNCVDKHRYGLFYNDKLVSLMTFSKKRNVLGNKTSTNNDFELTRFCNENNLTVVGSFSKLLKHFIKEVKPNKIETYADIRWSGLNFENTVYHKNGFEFVHYTNPNYWYVNLKMTGHKLHRYNFRKDVLVKEGYDKNKTESQIMEERGFDRIWDCGSMKFELKV